MTDVEQLQRIDRASVGVLGHVGRDGAPNAVAVTPYVIDGGVVVTSTLALIDKAAALLADPRVTLSAGGIAVSGTATVEVDRSPRFFDEFIREQELLKYPPAKSLLALPFHRRLLPWYVGRVIVRIHADSVADQTVGDRVTVTVLDAHGRLRTWNAPDPDDVTTEQIAVGALIPDGPVLLLVHEEESAMRDLRQLAIRGTVADGTLRVAGRRGTLTPTKRSASGEVAILRALARRSRANRERLAEWPQYEPPTFR